MRPGMLLLVIAIALPHQAALAPIPAQRIAPLLHDGLNDLDLVVALARRLSARVQRLQDVVRS